jgi:type I restriction enzyme M protein
MCLKCKDIEDAVRSSRATKEWKAGFDSRFSDFKPWLYEELIDELSLVLRNSEETRLATELFGRLDGIELIDRYDAYQMLDDEWQQISIDLEVLQTEGFDAVRRVDPRMVMKKQRGKEVEVQDGRVGHVLPFELVQRELLSDDAAKVAAMEARLPAIASEVAEILEGLTDEEKSDAGDAVNEAGDAFVASKLKSCAKALREEMGIDARAEDSLPNKLDAAASLFDEERVVKRRLKDAKTALDDSSKKAIEGLNDDQAHMLLSAKWIDPLVRRIGAMPDAVIGSLVNAIHDLEDKYATTYAGIDAQIQEAESELVDMLGQLTGNEFDMAGIRELAYLLGGDAR